MLLTEESEKEVAGAHRRAAAAPTVPGAKAMTSHPDRFARRHIGPSADETAEMLELLGYPSLEALMDEAIPAQIRLGRPLELPAARAEHEVLTALKEIASQNQVFRSYIGMGYYDCLTPLVIQRNLLENPGWYTQYTPYQAEISQGRLPTLPPIQTIGLCFK